MEELLSNARVVDESKIDTSKVSILSKIKIRNRGSSFCIIIAWICKSGSNLCIFVRKVVRIFVIYAELVWKDMQCSF